MKTQRSVALIPLLYVVIILLVNVLAVALDQTLAIEDETMRMIRIGSIVNLFFYVTLFVLYIVLFLPPWKRTLRHFVTHLPKMTTSIVIGIISMLGTMFVMGYIYLILGVNEEPVNQVILEMQLTGPMFDRISLVLFAVVFAPFVEEMMFRLAGFQLLKRIPGIPMWGVIVITSLLFGMIHVLGDDIVQIVYYAGLGIVLGTVYYKSNNIIVPIVVHMIFNIFVTISMFATI